MKMIVFASALAAIMTTTAGANEVCNNAAVEFGNIVLRKVASKHCVGFKPTESYEAQIQNIATVMCPRFKTIFDVGAQSIETAAGHDIRASAATYCSSTLANIGP